MMTLTTEQITTEFIKKFKHLVKRTKCPYCGKNTDSATGEHYNCYLNATSKETSHTYQIRNQVMHSRS